MRSRAWYAMFVLLVVSGCSGEGTIVNPDENPKTNQNLKSLSGIRLTGTTSATATVFANGTASKFASPRVPFISTFDGTTFPLPITDRLRVLESMIQVSSVGLSVDAAGSDLFRFASTNDPEATLDTWFEANSSGWQACILAADG